MIIDMTKLRVLGPRDRLREVVDALQDLELLHLGSPRAADGVRPIRETRETADALARLRELAAGMESVLHRLPGSGESIADGRRKDGPTSGPDGSMGPGEIRRWERLVRHLDHLLTRLASVAEELERERSALRRFRELLSLFDDLLLEEEGRLGAAGPAEGLRAFHLLLRDRDGDAVDRLRAALADALGESFRLLEGTRDGRDRAVLLLAPPGFGERVERLLAEADVRELELPGEVAGGSLPEVAARLPERLEELESRLAGIRETRERAARRYRAELEGGIARVGDRILELEALDMAGETEHAFVVEGWLPGDGVDRLEDHLRDRFGEVVVVERIATEQWRGEAAPVALENPRLFRPFETITELLPLPRYGSIDPTPFVAVFFPMFFGVILGDVAYGLVLGALAGWLRLRSAEGTTLRSVAEIAGACAAFTVVFGFAYGELLGDLGRRMFGLEPFLFDREEALVPFLALAVALGVVHVALGLVLGVVAAFHEDPRESIGRGVSAFMVLLVVVALLAGAETLPPAFFTPAVVALLVSFVVLVAVEGLLAPVELLSTLGNVLSYARIMALGTASVMMAVVANRLVGTIGGALVGALFGLLFHLVNFALGVFGPTVHGLRLHYVEFFGKFYSPGGERYRPLAHWKPGRPTAR